MCATTYLADSLGRRLALRRQQGAFAPETAAAWAQDSSAARALSDAPGPSSLHQMLLERSQIQITTLTFRDLTEKLWGLQGDERSFIGQAAREALVDELLAEFAQADYAESLQTAGGRRFLTEVVRAGAVSGTLNLRGRGRLAASLGPVVAAYRERLQARLLIEPDAALLALAQRGVYKEAAYGFLGFTDFPLAQLAYVRMLLARTEVAVAVTCEPAGDATVEGQRFAAAVRELGESAAQEAVTSIQVMTDSQDAAAAELCALRAGFLHDDPDGAALPEADQAPVRLIKTQGEDEEILAAVQAAQAALNTITLQSKIAASGPDEHPATDDAPVALIFRHLGSKIGRLARTLDFCQIPAAFDVKVPFRQAGLGAALCALLQLPCATDDLATVASGYLLSAYSGKTQAQAAAIEQCLREGRPGYARYCAELCSRLGVPELRHLTAQRWAQLATEMLFRAARIERNDYLRQLDFAAHKTFLSQLAEQWELALGALDTPGTTQAVAADPDPDKLKLDPQKILVGLSTARVNLTPAPGSTRLLVSEASRVRGRQFNTVILAGLAQQDFAVTTEPSFSEQAIAQLTGHTEPDKLAGEHQLWYDLLGCARQSLVLVAQDRDLSGQKLVPSALLEELRDASECPGVPCPQQAAAQAAGEAGQQAGHGSDPDPAFAGPGAQQRAQDLRLLQTFTTPGSAKAARLIGAPDDPKPAAPSCPERGRLTGLDFGAHATPPFAVTTLEHYARCPYAWFLSRHVARKGIRDNVDAINEGLILHTALQQFYEQAPAELGEAHVRVTTLPQARQLLDRCFEEAWQAQLGAETAAQLPATTQISLEALRVALRGFLADETAWMPGFTPRYFEKKFGGGDDESGPASSVAGVAVRGVIDRIDTYEPPPARPAIEAEAEVEAEAAAPPMDTPAARATPAAAEEEGLFFIIDYKRTGAAGGGTFVSRVNHKEIQATVYGLVAQQLLAPLRYAGSSYRNITNPRNLRIEHPTSLRARYNEQMGFPEKGPRGNWSAPSPISDTRKKGEPSTYEKGIASIEAIVAGAAAGLAAGDATITVPLDTGGNEKDTCPFAAFCLFSGCSYYKRKSWS